MLLCCIVMHNHKILTISSFLLACAILFLIVLTLASTVPVNHGSLGSVDVRALVWDGSGWVDGDNATGPFLVSGPVQLSVVVVNTGNVPLTGVSVSDSKFGFVPLNQTTLAPGAVAIGNFSVTWVSGQQVSVASVTGTHNGLNFTDSDSAYYFGFVVVQKYVRIACIGDSITGGSAYPIDLNYLLGFNEYTVESFGLSGATVTLNSNKPYLGSSDFQAAKNFIPDVVIIMLGTNDATTISFSKDKFEADYTTLIKAFQALASTPQIWLVKPPPIYPNTLGLSNTSLTQSVIPSIENVANTLGLPIIDVHTPLLTHPDYFFDGVHPNIEGSRIIAEEIYKAII